MMRGLVAGAAADSVVVKKITDDHKIAAAEALASLVDNPTPEEVIPSPFDDRVVPAVAQVIR